MWYQPRAGKVMSRLAQSNGSLLPGGMLKSHPQADFLYTGISSGSNARIMGKVYLFTTADKCHTAQCPHHDHIQQYINRNMLYIILYSVDKYPLCKGYTAMDPCDMGSQMA